MQQLFEAAWQELYPGLIEWVGLSNGGALTAVDAATKTLVTDFDKYQAAVANVIPPQKAGHAADLAGVADRTGWCPVDPLTFESQAAERTSMSSATRPLPARCRARPRPRNRRARSAPRAIVALLAGQAAGSADADQLVLQPDRAGLRDLAARHLSPGRRPILPRSTAGAIISPLDAPRARAQRRGRTGRRLVSRPSPARCSDDARGSPR